jgi:hypothetical protein
VPKQPAIPLDIQADVQQLVDEFNRKNITKENPLLRMMLGGNGNNGYAARFKGKFLYLDRVERGKRSPI